MSVLNESLCAAVNFHLRGRQPTRRHNGRDQEAAPGQNRSFDSEAEFAPKRQPPSIEYGESHFVPRQGIRSLCLLGAPGVLPWAWSVWREITPLLSPFVGSPRGKPFVRSSQTMGLGKQHRSVAFGRMGWDQSHTPVGLTVHLRAARRRDLEFRWNRKSGRLLGTYAENLEEAVSTCTSFARRPASRTTHLNSAPFSSSFAASSAGARRVELRAAMTTIAKLLDSPFSVWKHRAPGHPGWPFRRLSGRCAGFRSRFRPLQECRPSRAAAGPGHLHRDLGDPLPRIEQPGPATADRIRPQPDLRHEARKLPGTCNSGLCRSRS